MVPVMRFNMKNLSKLAAEFMTKGRSRTCPIYDMHGHFGDYKGIYFPNRTPETMIATMDRCGVKMLFFVSHASLLDPERGNLLNAAIVRKYPNRLRAYWSINPNYPRLIAKDLKNFSRYRKEFVGFKFLADYHRYPIDGENYRPVLEYADAHRLMILIHTWGGSAYNSPKHVERIAQKYPNVVMLMGHSGAGDWDNTCRLARTFPNVYMELTGVLHAPGVIEKLVSEGGSHKMLFGTDLPWFDPHYTTGCILFAHITDADRHNIFHKNAERILSSIIST